ncbi:hypothetical protein BLA29_011065 [Euroglyphus maynei]|uniref:Uncharacterized protein n=1 Tax=Euroglyphus maynei TaxID=6958 RepID=A0A1Y3B9Z2_EURMA|nr:hypothetical protein BLA29_011065 [Euroglyphus maynei]
MCLSKLLKNMCGISPRTTSGKMSRYGT